jgi:hypothetical protein
VNVGAPLNATTGFAQDELEREKCLAFPMMTFIDALRGGVTKELIARRTEYRGGPVSSERPHRI